MQVTELGTGVTDVVEMLESGLTDRLIAKIPFLGEVDLSNTFIGDLKRLGKDLAAKLKASGSTSLQIQRSIQRVIFDSVGPGGVNLITLDPLHHDDENVDDAEEAADFRDVDVVFDLEKQEFAVNLEISGSKTLEADFDLGLDALIFEFATNGGVELELSYSFVFGFGISLADGFFFQLQPNVQFDTEGMVQSGSPEIELNAEVRLKPGTTLDARLFFLEVTAPAQAIGGLERRRDHQQRRSRPQPGRRPVQHG